MIFKEFLRSRGIRQDWLAEQLGVKIPIVWRWANGKSYPSKKNIDKILKIFRKDSPVHLFGARPRRSDVGKKRK